MASMMIVEIHVFDESDEGAVLRDLVQDPRVTSVTRMDTPTPTRIAPPSAVCDHEPGGFDCARYVGCPAWQA